MLFTLIMLVISLGAMWFIVWMIHMRVEHIEKFLKDAFPVVDEEEEDGDDD